MGKKHFHVLTGVRGFYEPDTDEIFLTRKEAEIKAVHLAAEFRNKGSKVSGTLKDGYYIVDAANCIQITPCLKTECCPT